MVTACKNLWSLVRSQPEIDPNDLAQAVQAEAMQEGLDYRTRLLIRDSVDALRTYWGGNRVERWLATCSEHKKIANICQAEFDEIGFPSIRKRLMEKTNPEDVRLFFAELAKPLRKPLRMNVGGSIALILREMLSRNTEDIDVVDEVPAEFRQRHELLENLLKRYGLLLAHFQQHYLPSGWANRLEYYDSFGELTVYLVDPYDVFLSKLTSIREKDFDDMRVVKGQLDKATLIQRIKDTMQSAFAEPKSKDRSQNNWKLLFGEDLPS